MFNEKHYQIMEPDSSNENYVLLYKGVPVFSSGHLRDIEEEMERVKDGLPDEDVYERIKIVEKEHQREINFKKKLKKILK